jgi:lambda family phage tail tape measure protein
MADMVVKATLDDKISPALAKIEKNVKSVNDNFGALKNALAGLALGSAIQNAYRFADGIQDITDATGIATNAIIGFTQAVQFNGGTVDGAQNSLIKFNQTIGEAADGSAKAQDAFSEVNISLKDLATLSQQQLFEKTIIGLGQITDKSKQAVVATELLGKGFKGVNVSGVAAQYQALSLRSQDAAASTKSAADAIQQGEIAMAQFQKSILQILKPINDFIAGLDPQKIQQTVDAVTRLGAVLFVLYGYIKITGAVVATMLAALAKLGGTIATVGGILLAFATRLVTTFTLFGKIILIAGAVNEAIKIAFNIDVVGSFVKGIASAYDAVKKFLGIKDKMDSSGAGAGRGGNDAITKQLQERGEQLRKESEELRKVQDAYEKQKKQISQSSDAFKKQNEEFIKGIQLETSLIGKSEEYAEIVRTIGELNKKAATETEKLRQQKQLLTGEDAKLAPLYDIQIAKIEEVRKADEARITSAIQGLQSAKAIEQARVITLEQMSQQMQKQQEIAGITNGVFSNLQKQLGEIQFGKEQKGRSVFEQQQEQIKRNITLLENDMANAVTEAFSTEDGIGNVEQYGIELKKVYDLTNQLRQAQLGELDASTKWATGWQDAFTKYTDSATNAATMAGNAFNSITSNMNSAIDNFVTTGKFKFGDFARSVIQDLIKIELKAQASKLLTGASNMLGSFVGSIFGFAEGGNPPVNKPSIVGEKGPELFVPKTAGTIIPNGGTVGNAAQGNTYITNNISAIDAKSVAQLFAENRKTLFGSVQMAQKEMSYGR